MRKAFVLPVLLLCLASFAAYAQDHQTTGDIRDYRTACNAGIDNLAEITGNNLAMSSLFQVTKNSVSIYSNPSDMQRAMAFLRADVVGYLQVVNTFVEGQNFTGLVGNQSFDTGELSWWNCFGFDLSKVTIGDVTRAVLAGSVSPLAKAVTLKSWNEETKAVENTGDDAVSGGKGKFYLSSNQLTMQPVFGLPAGIYTLQAKVACKPGLLGLNKVHLSALVVPSDVVRNILGIIVTTTQEWEDLLSTFVLASYIEPILENGKLYTESVSCKNLSTFSDGELNFIINEGDLVILGMDAGLVSFIGTEQYRADNVRLVGRWSPKDYLAAKAELEKELEGQTTVEANCNADLADAASEPAFTYDKAITENFNQTLAEATDLADDKLSDILADADIENLTGMKDFDEITRSHFSAGIQALKDAKDAFYKRAFIAPTADECFNILMKEDWTSFLTPKWTGNAVTVSDDMTMRFSTKPGQSIYTLAFRFERASDIYTNRLRAFIADGYDKYYLGSDAAGLVLTTDASKAVTITAVPSYTEEGVIKLMTQTGNYLGTSSSKNNLIETDLGSLLRTTRTGLAVVPASETGFSVSIPQGRRYGTLILPFDADIPQGMSAFAITGVNEDLPFLEKERQTQIKANIPLYITGAPGNYSFSGVSQAVRTSYGQGLLMGRHTAYTATGTDEFGLTQEDGIIMFRRADGGWPVAAHECYLKCDLPASFICLDREDATGINDPKDLRDLKDYKDFKDYGESFNLAGQQVAGGKLPRGIYVVGGKKVVVR